MSEEQANDREVQLLRFRVGAEDAGHLLCIDSLQVKEVLEDSGVRSVPQAASPFSGLLSLRGIPVPVVDVCAMLGLESANGGGSRLVVCEATAGIIALRVQRLQGISGLTRNEVMPVPKAMLHTAEALFCSSVVHTADDEYILMLSIEAVVAGLSAKAA